MQVSNDADKINDAHADVHGGVVLAAVEKKAVAVKEGLK